MYLRNVTLALAIAAAFALPARAQQGSPAQNQFPEPAIPWGYVPSLADVQKAKAAENPSVRAVAQDVYGQLVSGKLNRSKLTQDVNAAFTDTAKARSRSVSAVCARRHGRSCGTHRLLRAVYRFTT
jgi:hypothetical protein